MPEYTADEVTRALREKDKKEKDQRISVHRTVQYTGPDDEFGNWGLAYVSEGNPNKIGPFGDVGLMNLGRFADGLEELLEHLLDTWGVEYGLEIHMKIKRVKRPPILMAKDETLIDANKRYLLENGMEEWIM